MENRRYDNIEYDEQWLSTSTVSGNKAKLQKYDDYTYMENDNQEDYEEYEEEKPKKAKKKKEKLSGTQRIIKFQLIICFIIALAFFTIKSFLPDIYTQFISWYEKEYNSSLIITDSGDIT